jgi:uncharacterized protein (TIGR00369 family)
VLTEPVRGTVPEPGLFSLPGVEQLRAYHHERLPGTPHARMLGYRLTQLSYGSAVLSQPISPWFEIYDGYVDLTPTIQLSIYIAALSLAPAATHVRPVTLSVRHLRSCTTDDDAVVARSRVLHAGTQFTTVESVVEDSLGRGVAHATGSVVAQAMEPPPALTYPLDERVHDPVHSKPDPPRRPPPAPRDRKTPLLPSFLGLDILEAKALQASTRLTASEWFSLLHHEVEAGFLASHASATGALVLAEMLHEQERAFTFEVTTTFFRPVVTDGKPVVATARVGSRTGDVVVVETESVDADGRPVLVSRGTQLVRARRAPSARRPATRVLLTVLFTDLVASTERAQDLGDARWRELLNEHDDLVRRLLDSFAGREIKTTGDGFLMTFDSPSRALHCARAIRDGLGGLGLQMRAGAHTGECEVLSDDVSGFAVHLASRIQAAASPDEILVSSTVRELVAGSDLVLTPRGKHELKGIVGESELFAVD